MFRKCEQIISDISYNEGAFLFISLFRKIIARKMTENSNQPELEQII
ncbi:hypothetical protein SAMN05421784_1183 [Xenorhabdus koppenhoeferi]|uniref:Uncharacterized protein n=1 Tax=Xenorhabdus koppenhoeferi TaxID=351659 RepID=A0A1I7I4E9_9GAMM|nr:hypothetical protein SAMN05421784_1183 [Xenorhabdus koppenhoeferi]